MNMLTICVAMGAVLAMPASTIPPDKSVPVPDTPAVTAPQKPNHSFMTPYGVQVDDDVCDQIADQSIFIMPDGSFTTGNTCAEAVKKYMLAVPRKSPRA